MSESALNAMAQQFLDLTLCKTRYDPWDLQWYTESPFWRRTSMKYSREYKIIPDYEIGEAKHGKAIHDILDEAAHLLEHLALYKKTAHQGEMQRVDYLIEHVGNLHFRTRMLMGERCTYDQMTQALYTLTAPAFDPTHLERIVAELGQALPGSGTPVQKIRGFRRAVTLPRECLLEVLTGTTRVFHDITCSRIKVSGNSMPRVRVRELADEHSVFLSVLFGYDYNHLEYERNFNLLYPWTAERVVEFIGHEQEPGHLTYFEKRLQTMIDTCWPEMAIVSQYSSSSAFSEGAARMVIDLCFDKSMDKLLDFEREYIFKPAKLDLGLLGLMPLWHAYFEAAGYAQLEVTRKFFDGVWDESACLKFLDQYGITEENAQAPAIHRMMGDPGHYVAHDYARDIVREYFDHMEPTVDGQWQLYADLCRAHITMGGMLDRTVYQIPR